jgi:hypothetical protein
MEREFQKSRTPLGPRIPFFIAGVGRQEVPTMWEVIAFVVVCAVLGWLIAIVVDHRRHV